jgi:hypothetical protein
MESDQHIGKVVGVIAVMLLLRPAALAPGDGGRHARLSATTLSGMLRREADGTANNRSGHP